MTIEADGHASATTPMPKPPTQVAGVVGIADIPIVVGSGDAGKQAINWNHILTLPPFQMFAVERKPSLANKFEGQGLDSVTAWMAQYEPDDLYQQYCDWHKAKGYWPNESPEGELINA